MNPATEALSATLLVGGMIGTVVAVAGVFAYLPDWRRGSERQRNAAARLNSMERGR